MTSPAHSGEAAALKDTALQVVLLADAGAPAALLHECVLTTLPTTRLTTIHPSQLAEHRVPDAPCAVIDARFGGQTGLEALRALRAGGFAGGAVLLTDNEEGEEIAVRAAPLGVAHCITRAALAERPAELAQAIVLASGLTEGSPALRELRRTQRLIAAGEVAMGLQHAMNNPLTALLAEAQLLELEELPAEHRASVQRMIELARRVIALVRRLDVIGPTGRSS